MKPCPFCGEYDPELLIPARHIEFDYWSVICDCGAEGPPSDSKDGAVEEWNNRYNVVKSRG